MVVWFAWVELFLSREMATMGRALVNQPESAAAWRMASEAATVAERQSEERFSAAYQCAILAIVSGDLTQAEKSAREAISLAPNWYKPHLLLAQILQAMGRMQEPPRNKRWVCNFSIDKRR